MADYYIKKSKKVSDFFIGFVGYLLTSAILNYVLSFLFTSVANLQASIYSKSSFIFFITYSLIFIILTSVIPTIIAFKKNRKYIGIGIISAAGISLVMAILSLVVFLFVF